MTRCVSCGQPMERGPSGHYNHHCSEDHEKRKEAASRRAHTQEPEKQRRPSEARRLADGFFLRNLGES